MEPDPIRRANLAYMKRLARSYREKNHRDRALEGFDGGFYESEMRAIVLGLRNAAALLEPVRMRKEDGGTRGNGPIHESPSYRQDMKDSGRGHLLP